MHLPLLIIATTLIGGWILTFIFSGIGISKAGELVRAYISPDSKISLWSLIFFLFFPKSHPPLSSSWLRELD